MGRRRDDYSKTGRDEDKGEKQGRRQQKTDERKEGEIKVDKELMDTGTRKTQRRGGVEEMSHIQMAMERGKEAQRDRID